MKNLATELIQEIVHQLQDQPSSWDPSTVDTVSSSSRNDLANLRLVCKHVQPAATASLFSTLKLGFMEPFSPRLLVEMVNRIADKTSEVGQFVRVLVIVTPYGGGEYTKEFFKVLRGLRQPVGSAISSMKNLKSVSWQLGNEHTLTQSIVNAIKGLPKVDEFYLELRERVSPGSLALYGISGLCRLRVKELVPGDDLTSLLPSLESIIKHSPGLELIQFESIQGADVIKRNHGCILHSLLKDVPGTSVLKLRHLHVAGETWSLKFDRLTLPHLQFLSTLRIMGLPAHEQGGIWSALGANGIFLREIHVDDLVPQFLEYIKLYSGLEAFSLDTGRYREGLDAFRNPGLLYSTLAINHGKALVKLSLLVMISSRTITREHMTRLAECKGLRELKITFDPDLMTDEGYMNNILIEARNLPLLQRLHLRCARTRKFFGCGYAAGQYFSRRAKLMDDAVLDLEIPIANRACAHSLRGSTMDMEIITTAGTYQSYLADNACLRFTAPPASEHRMFF